MSYKRLGQSIYFSSLSKGVPSGPEFLSYITSCAGCARIFMYTNRYARCAICNDAPSTGQCDRCGLDVCSAHCLRQDWSKMPHSDHHKLCGSLSKITKGVFEMSMVEGKRGREQFASNLPQNYTPDTKYAPRTRQANARDPYVNIIQPYMANSDAWLKRFAQMDAQEIHEAIEQSPSFRFYFARNDRFWYWYRQYH